MSKPIVTGILAYGMSGKVFHAPFIHAHKGFELYGITERSKKEASERYENIISFDTIDGLIQDPTIELVIVNTPNYTHFDYAKQALKAGKHVLVEKPFAASRTEALELFQLATTVDRKIMPYHNRRWDSDFQSVKNIITSGKLGKLIEVNFRFDRYRKEIGPKTFKETPIPASGVAYDLGAHVLDQAISLFGKPEKFTRSAGIHRDNSLVDDYSTFHLLYPNQLNVFVTVSLLTAEPLPSYVIHGSDGSFMKSRTDVQEEQLLKGLTPNDTEYGIEEEGKDGILTVINGDGDKTRTPVSSPRGDYMGLFDAVYKQIRFDEAFPVTEEHILSQMEILEHPAL